MASARGQSVLYAVLLMPLLLLVLSLVADVGALQVERVRLRWALDTALVDAVGEVDPGAFAASGRLSLSPDAIPVFRRYLAANLEPMRRLLAGATPESVAASAEVAISDGPGANPFDGHRLDRPAISARVRIPVRASLLALAGLDGIQTLTASGDAEIRDEAAAHGTLGGWA
jgi:hypothetical protein